MTDASRERPTQTNYRILMELGRGGMGAVHLVMTSGPQAFAKLVVFKTLLPELLRSAAARRMFLEEARISARIAHPNVVRVHEVVEHDGVPTMVMEYLRGLPLSTVLGDDPTRLTLQLHLYVLRHVLSGLHAAHELRDNDGTSLGLVHRDVSPHNIFLEFDGGVKVLDFGIAKAGRSQIRTETGELKGKLRYMAPEQFCGDPNLDRRADIFSVGVMLWEVLAGHRIWEQQSDADVMRHLLNAEIPALPESPLIPAGLSAVCRRALEPSAAARYGTAAEFARELELNIGDLREGGGAEDLSAFMMAQFGEAHESTQRAIEAQVNSPLAEIDPPAADSRPTGMPEGRTNALRTTRPSGRVARSRRWARRWAVGAGILGILALAMIGSVVWLDRPRQAGAPRGSAGDTTIPSSSAATAPACQPGFKTCAGECVSIDRPDLGCSSAECAACDVTHSITRCNARHTCDIAVCYAGYDNCDGDPGNGCETDVRTDPNNCGGCRRQCAALPHARNGCGDGCTIWRCDDGFHDCNGAMADGCEVHTDDDPKNCGHCRLACATGQRCRAGRCIL